MTSLTLRPVRWTDDVVHPDDLDSAVSIYEAYERDRIRTVETGRAELAHAFAQPHTDREQTVLLLEDGVPCGSVWVCPEPPARDVYADIAVLPGEGDRERLEVCVEHTLRAAQQIAAAAPDPGWTLHTGCVIDDETLAGVMLGHGLEPVRRFYRMRIAADSPQIPAEAPTLPDGVELVVRDDEATRRAIWAVQMESFADHWNYTPSTYDDWWAARDAGDTRDPDGWWLLTVDGAPAAICLMDDSRAEFGEGYVSTLGVLRRFRGRGLAGLLLRRAFVRDRELGRVATQLDVDADNTTRAVGVYERVGMQPIHVFQAYVTKLGL